MGKQADLACQRIEVLHHPALFHRSRLLVTNFRAISHIGRQRHKLTAVQAERALAAVFTHDCGRGARKKDFTPARMNRGHDSPT